MAERRVQAISFFLLVILLSAWFVQRLWNGAAVEAFGWPRIDYRRSLVVVGSWGAAFVLVLTMISGARELMTPGAWKQNGPTYTLRGHEESSSAEDARLLTERMDRIGSLWQQLEHFADANRFPPRDAIEGIDWSIPGRPGTEYVYRGPLVENDTDLLAFEPKVFGSEQLALRANGRIVRMTSGELAKELGDAKADRDDD